MIRAIQNLLVMAVFAAMTLLCWVPSALAFTASNLNDFFEGCRKPHADLSAAIAFFERSGWELANNDDVLTHNFSESFLRYSSKPGELAWTALARRFTKDTGIDVFARSETQNSQLVLERTKTKGQTIGASEVIIASQIKFELTDQELFSTIFAAAERDVSTSSNLPKSPTFVILKDGKNGDSQLKFEVIQHSTTHYSEVTCSLYGNYEEEAVSIFSSEFSDENTANRWKLDDAKWNINGSLRLDPLIDDPTAVDPSGEIFVLNRKVVDGWLNQDFPHNAFLSFRHSYKTPIDCEAENLTARERSSCGI